MNTEPRITDQAFLAMVNLIIKDKQSPYRIRAQFAITRDELHIVGVDTIGESTADYHWHYASRIIEGVDYTPEWAAFTVDAVILHLNLLSLDCGGTLASHSEFNKVSRESQ